MKHSEITFEEFKEWCDKFHLDDCRYWSLKLFMEFKKLEDKAKEVSYVI